MTTKEWLALGETEVKSKKGYAHFDHRTSIRELQDYILNPEKIAHHGFYPFIHYIKKQIKYSKAGGKKEKPRDICYASHIDRCIYQYYSFLLGELYNLRVAKDGLSQTAVAYRTDLHQNNIDFAIRAFDFICSNSPCYIMIGDFTHFFDNLDHKYLKQQWCSLLGASRLPDDHYNVFKSVTQYNTWELTDLLEINHLKDNRAGRRELNSKPCVLTREEFKTYSNREHIKKNEKTFGIPQGSPISGLLANVYMLQVDKTINDLVSGLNGLYMRYSDDFIVVIPDTGLSASQAMKNVSDQFNKIVGLKLEAQKTQYFRYENLKLENCGARFGIRSEEGKRVVNFLGFTFNGESVSIRAKTTSKYYYRMYGKVKTIRKNGGCSPKGNRISKENLYALYSKKGAHGYRIAHRDGKSKWHSGNFLSYAQRANRKFRRSKFGKRMYIDKVLPRHMAKIRKALKRKTRKNKS